MGLDSFYVSDEGRIESFSFFASQSLVDPHGVLWHWEHVIACLLQNPARMFYTVWRGIILKDFGNCTVYNRLQL